MPIWQKYANEPTLKSSKQAARNPSLAMTMGDPQGIGPEVIVKALPHLQRIAHWTLFGHRRFLEKAARMNRQSLPRQLTIVEPTGRPPLLQSKDKKQRGEASLSYIHEAVRAIQEGTCRGLVTGPLCKAHIKAAGCPYPGHTELLAALAGARQTFLMMVGPRLRVTLVTLHVPLMQVVSHLSSTRIRQAIELTHEVLRKQFRIRRPKLAVVGLNPHAGEQGLFGDEEKRLIVPAIRAAHRKKIAVTGPHPADALFYQAANGTYDAVISLYHDQGLIPVKLLHFDCAVNMTLGLPFVRTSVDHGTAFDIAWKNKADPSSLIAAGKLAAQMVQNN